MAHFLYAIWSRGGVPCDDMVGKKIIPVLMRPEEHLRAGTHCKTKENNVTFDAASWPALKDRNPRSSIQ
ncbi:hypothetical protein KIN20_005168 [Parelaphostrongylus tenuis]|uniref:Uncharacterized protein n=1 Tax=Parelaphostrongylus tenuis TaxID=148309 RepID=A0AAD5LZN8_PARTN|nr:hypothetical protein KIN20_005168 [Parelaphostrongylus tenuis]